MSPRRMRVALLNTVILNGGDAAIASAIADTLREAFGDRLDLELLDGSPAAPAYYPEFSLLRDPHKLALAREHVLFGRMGRGFNELRLMFGAFLLGKGMSPPPLLLTDDEERALRALAEADLVVSTGGTYLVEHYALRGRIFNFRLVNLLRRPLVLYTQSMGPFTKPEVRGPLAQELDQARLILLRDPASLEHLKELGVTTPHAEVLPDSVFTIADAEELERATSRVVPDVGARVLVSVRKWTKFQGREPEEGMREYTESVRAMIRELVDTRAAHVTLLSTCQGIPEYWTDDSEVAMDVWAGLEPRYQERCEVDRAHHTLAELKAHYARADLVIATRMHAAIIALCAGTPVLPIEYEFKTRELFKALGLERWVLDISTVTPAGAVERLGQVLEEVEGARAALMAGVEEMRAGAARGAELTREAVERG